MIFKFLYVSFFSQIINKEKLLGIVMGFYSPIFLGMNLDCYIWSQILNDQPLLGTNIIFI